MRAAPSWDKRQVFPRSVSDAAETRSRDAKSHEQSCVRPEGAAMKRVIDDLNAFHQP